MSQNRLSLFTSQIFKLQSWSYFFQRICTYSPLRNIISDLIAASKPTIESSQYFPEQQENLRDLENNGICFFSKFLDNTSIQKIKLHLTDKVLSESFGEKRSGFTLSNLPSHVHVAYYSVKDLLSCRDVISVANNPDIINLASLYLGCKPTVSKISAWWSFPDDGVAQGAENYHRDVDEWNFIKFFVYLTDVDSFSGPHCYVQGSHKHVSFLKIRRINDSEVEHVFEKSKLLEIHGAAGDAFLENTFGLHKGKPCLKNPRLILQIQYSLNAIFVSDYRYKIPKNNEDELKLDPYIFRLYL
jgi:hypothetical protein